MSDKVLRASQWCYSGVWAILTRWFRVPKEPPQLPISDGEQIQTFRPCEGYLNYRRFFFWIGLTIIDVILSILWILLIFFLPIVGILITPLALAIIILPDIVAYIAIHLRYDTTWYLLSNRSMRIRRGIWVIHETTITFENIQNVHLQQGPIQRWFGFANLVVETAGGGGGASADSSALSGAHHGILEGLSNAAEIRDIIMLKLRNSRSAGLGDELIGRGAPQTQPGFSSEQVQLLMSIRQLASQMAGKQV